MSERTAGFVFELKIGHIVRDESGKADYQCDGSQGKDANETNLLFFSQSQVLQQEEWIDKY